MTNDARQNGKCTVPDLGIQVSQVINRQKAENEWLLQKLQQAKSEAIKEFAERLKSISIGLEIGDDKKN